MEQDKISFEKQKEYLNEAIEKTEREIEKEQFLLSVLKGRLKILEGFSNKQGKKTMAKPASKDQIKYYHQHGLGDTENLTSAEAWRVIGEHKKKMGEKEDAN